MTLTNSILAGIAFVSAATLVTTQGASEPVRSAPEYFVTADGDNAHLWVREGNSLRVVGHGICKDCRFNADDEHQDGDGHDHGKSGEKR